MLKPILVVNWRLITLLGLASSGLFTGGLALSETAGTAFAHMEGVILAQLPRETPLEEETKTFTGTNRVAIELPGGSKLAVGQNSLKSATSITLKTFENRREGGDPRFKPIGLHTVVELPLAQVSLSDSMTKTLFIYAPAFEGEYKMAIHPVQEVTIEVGKSKEYVFLDSYIPDFPVIITPAIIKTVLDAHLPRPETLRVSVQPVDSGDFFEVPPPESP